MPLPSKTELPAHGNSVPLPWFLGAGYVTYGAALLFVEKDSKTFAAATGVLGLTIAAHAALLWKRASDRDARILTPGDVGALGESLPEALKRTQGAVKGGPVAAPRLEDRVAILRRLTREGAEDPEVRAKALAVVSRRCGSGNDRKWCVPQKNFMAEISAIFEAFKDPRSEIAVRYTRDPITRDTYVSARKTLGNLHAGDCDDQAVALGALFMSIGYPVKFVVVQGKNAPGPSHIYIRVAVPPGGGKIQKWIPLDATMEGWRAGQEAGSNLVVKRWEFDV